MKTPEPLSTERLNCLCILTKMSAPNSMVEILREDLWSLVEMAKERNELLCADPAVVSGADLEDYNKSPEPSKPSEPSKHTLYSKY